MYFVYDGDEARLSDKISEGYEVGRVNWKPHNLQIVLVSKIPFKTNKTYQKTSSLYNILKSNLQKQVRRKDISAVATCEAMLELNTFDCLRRLVIISAEDVEISKQTSVIVWLMSSVSKNYSLTKRDLNFVLGYVNNLVNHNTCSLFKVDNEKLISIDDILNSNNPDKEYIAGIFFRTAYGGMKGDMEMLNKTCSYVINNTLFEFKNSLLIKTELRIHEAAIDFHVWPDLCDVISKDTNLSCDIVKELIWNCSSKINKRCPDAETDERWDLIKDSFYSHGKKYLEKVLTC